jgi:hypothetical protein
MTPYYEVGTPPETPFVRFTNRFLAAHYAGKHNLNMRFNMYDEVFDQCNWSLEPDLSWDALLDIRAQQIAAKNKPIVLYFSGGTDSYTIYKVFERNNIHIDAIYTRPRYDCGTDSLVQVYELFDRGLYDKTTKIIIRDLDDANKKAYANPDWIWQDGVKNQFSMLAGDSESNSHVAEIIGTDDFIGIIGLEKPRLKFMSTGVYSYQDDENYGRPMGNENIDCFYISPDLPDLHIKQSYMLLKYIKQLSAPQAMPIDLVKFNKIHVPFEFNWLDYSLKGCGRYGDLNLSDRQHLRTWAGGLTIPTGKFDGSEFRGRGDTLFRSGIGTQMFKNYTDGIMSVVNDKAAEFLNINQNNFFGMRSFPSKMYKLTF